MARIQWMWGDSARHNLLNWSRPVSVEAVVQELAKYATEDRPVLIFAKVVDSVECQWRWQDKVFSTWASRKSQAQTLQDMRAETKEQGRVRVVIQQRGGHSSSHSDDQTFATMHEAILFVEGFDAAEQQEQNEEERDIVFCSPTEALDVLDGATAGNDDGADTPFDPFRAIDAHRLRRADFKRQSACFGSWPPCATPERCRQCIECTSVVSDYCDVCGLGLCAGARPDGDRCLTLHPIGSGDNAPERLKSCRRCVAYVEARAASRSAVRSVIACSFRSGIAATGGLSLMPFSPPFEETDDCSGCGLLFRSMVAGALRHHCRACGRALCVMCFCGSITCMGNSLVCPHKSQLPQFGYTGVEKVCKECLPYVQVRFSARGFVSSIMSSAERYAEHALRVRSYVESPGEFPLYRQDYVDTNKDKVVRAGTMAVHGAKFLTPLLSLPYAMGVNAAYAVWNYGQYGLVGLFFSQEIVEGLQTLQKMSGVLQKLEPRELLVGMLYLSAEQRRESRSDPGVSHREALQCGSPVHPRLLELLIGLSGIGMHAPYEDKAFEVQRLAMQQHWRLVTERISESWKHRPAWCLYVHETEHIAVIAIRGTDVNKSLGGDLFTDFDALPERAEGEDGAIVHAHSGMLASARALETELRQAIRALVAKGHRITVIGHSLGAGVVALLVWLLKHGTGGAKLPEHAQVFGIGYAMPSVVDYAASKAMRPYFTSVVNSVDLVPRLNLTSIQQLADNVVHCARESVSDLDQDAEAYLERISSVWAPNLRKGTREQPGKAIMESSDVQADPGYKKSLLRRLSKTASSVFETRDAKTEAARKNSDELESACEREPEAQTEILECAEGATLWIPGGTESLLLAWYGDFRRPWQTREGIGKECTEEVRSLLCEKRTIIPSNAKLGDPCPKTKKRLLVLVSGNAKHIDLYQPGMVVWMYRYHGSMRAAEVPCDMPSLQKIICDKRMVIDHSRFSYHRALLTVHAQSLASRSVEWKSFSEAGDYCPCCHSEFDWNSTTKSKKQRWLSMTNCRSCGNVVCISCASTRQALQDAGIIDPARICDTCAWSGPEGLSAVCTLPQVFAAASQALSNATDGNAEGG